MAVSLSCLHQSQTRDDPSPHIRTSAHPHISTCESRYNLNLNFNSNPEGQALSSSREGTVSKRVVRRKETYSCTGCEFFITPGSQSSYADKIRVTAAKSNANTHPAEASHVPNALLAARNASASASKPHQPKSSGRGETCESASLGSKLTG
ncbi:hypothetical protein EJ06DRAFT_373926 [Trichodelitschia bisporula]|uniref:Uncharacterized protein n=1 Tax=Trichodelitschia bisporula TaxID=703511 RepID=A0A6G1I1V0_9PEZI|nr:hypothetical protein EJ06DRAFT_373926 [Trichodelitschia bisporula]